ncbi:MAG: hypothetical protein H8E72_09830 [Candidatus Marinimicrobia bacterium]|nr:hypothetical protein [Candidatus Neomarinimicrobiota bacterium]
MKLFSRNKESTDPADIIQNSLLAVVNRISDSLEDDGYHWTKPWGVKRFESLVLAKFMMDYSFNGLAEDKLKDEEKIAFVNLCSSAFSKLFNDEFSQIGLNFEDMQEELQLKVDAYFDARRGSKPPHCWHNIYQLVTRSKSKEELEDDVKKKTAGLELIKGNENFSGMVPQYESQINILKDKAFAFDSAEMMLPHMVRFTKDKLRAINIKKIKALSKKLAKKEKGKKK